MFVNAQGAFIWRNTVGDIWYMTVLECILTSLPADVGEEATAACSAEAETLPATSLLLHLVLCYYALGQPSLILKLKTIKTQK